MNRLKLSLAALLLTISAGLTVPSIGAQETIIRDDEAAGDCIYAEYLSSSNQCTGLTTRLCKGPPECPRS